MSRVRPVLGQSGAQLGAISARAKTAQGVSKLIRCWCTASDGNCFRPPLLGLFSSVLALRSLVGAGSGRRTTGRDGRSRYSDIKSLENRIR